MRGSSGFLDELRKRGVIRTGLLYAAGAFALLEFADIAFPRLGLPDGAVNVVLWVGLAGFPLALIASWVIEVRAERDSGQMRSWFSPATLATSAVLVALGIGMGLVWGAESRPPSITEPAAAPGGGRAPAVAVLRFTDMSGSDEYGYFAAGLSEEISTDLSRFPGIRVISPRATSYFDAANEDLSQIDDELGVRYLLRGSVRREPTRARIAAQLLEASTGSQLWGESYDAALEPSELLATQNRIARRVASTIADTFGVLAQLGQTEARRRGTDSLEAYDCVLLGMSYFKVHTAEVHARARDCLERAVEIDPDYAEAWAHLAHLYREEVRHRYNPKPDSLARAAAAARRAIDLDNTSSMAYYSLSLTLFDELQFEQFRAAAERAIGLNPNDTATAAGLSIYLAYAGYWERAIELTDEVEELNPIHSGWIHNTRAMDHYRRGDFEQALAEVALAGPGSSSAAPVRAASHARLGRIAEARSALEQFLELDPDFAADPMDWLQRTYRREVVVQRLLEGLRLAGLEIEPGKPARILQ